MPSKQSAMDGDQRILKPAQSSTQSLDASIALQVAGLGAWEIDSETNQLSCDQRCQELAGLRIVRPVPVEVGFQHSHPDDLAQLLAAIRWAMNPESDGVFDETFRTPDTPEGGWQWVRFWGQRYTTERSNVRKLIGVAQAISSLVLAHQQTRKEQPATQPSPYQTLSQNNNWLKSLLEQAPVAIALLEGPDYRIKLANASIYAIWQLPPDHESVLGKPVFEAFPNIAGLGLETLLDQVRQTKLPVHGTEQPAVFNRNGQPQTVYINFVYAPIYTGTGNVDIVVVATEVTEQVLARQKTEESETRYRGLSEELAAANQEYAALNDELEKSNGLLHRSNENLQQFAYVASHDLQEPLRKIRQFGDLLKTRYATATGEEYQYIERMQSAAGRMSTLIKDLLDYSRLTTRQEARRPVSLAEIIQKALTTLELSVTETKATVTVDPLPTITGDPFQLEQLFQNLLSNALKFRRTDASGNLVPPVVAVNAQRINRAELPPSVKPVQTASEYYRINVVDNGAGFDEKYLDRIFQMFQRLYGKNEYAGTGIGLAICEKVATNHGGAITASSQGQQGATFQVYFPCELPSGTRQYTAIPPSRYPLRQPA